MTFDAQFFVLITPVAVVTAIASGIAFGWLVRTLRPSADPHLITFLCVTLAALWYVPQALQLLVTTGGGAGTLGRMSLFLAGFVVPMWLVLRWRKS